MSTISFTFDNPLNYTYNFTEMEITGGLAKLLLQTGNIDFTQNFTNDTGFVYDNTKAEFTGGKVQQIDQRPTDATFYASYENNINGSWGDGTLTGTPTGGAAVAGGKLDLAHNDIRYVDYDADLNADSQQTGTIRFRILPNYTGAPASTQIFFRIDKAAGNTDNNILIFHKPTGQLALRVLSNIGAGIIDVDLGAWAPVALTQYEIELNYDITAGATRLFIDGVQFGGTQAGTGTRDSNIGSMRIGSDTTGVTTSNFYIEDIIIYSSVQHTANYTPDWSSIPVAIYVENAVILPEMEHTGDGSIIAFNSFTTTESGSPRYTLQIGRSGSYLYWDGAAWSVSDGTYTQATNKTVFNANVGSLPVTGEKYGQFKIIFPGSNTISSVDALTANMTVNTGYLTTNPKGEINTKFRADDLLGFTATETKSGTDEIKYTLSKNGQEYYYNGSVWTTSNGSYSQANTAVQIETNKASFFSDNIGIEMGVYFYLHSGAGSSTPLLKELEIQFDFTGTYPVLTEATVWGWYYDIGGNANSSGSIKVQVTRWLYGTRTVIDDEYIAVSINSEGYFEVTLKYEDDIPVELKWNFDGNIIVTNFKAGISRFKELLR